MNILFIVPYVPNLIRVRPYNFIKYLAKSGHDITLVTLTTSNDDLEDLRHLESFCKRVFALPQNKARIAWNSLLAVLAGAPLQSVYSWNPRLGRLIRSLIHQSTSNTEFHIIHVEHLRGARFGLTLQESSDQHKSVQHPRPPIIWDSVDCISHLFRQASKQSKRPASRFITRFELPRTERFERQLLGKFDRILVTSPADRQALLELRNGDVNTTPISVLANGVDLDYFCPDPTVDREPNSVVLSGKMSYHANETMALRMAEDIMPRIWEKSPETRLYIVGKDPPMGVIKLGSDPRITVTGTVRDMRVFLRKAAVAVSPIVYGAGIQNKILEAMACETPVVTTSQGSLGVGATSGEDLITGDSAQKFADSVTELLTHPELRARIGKSGRKYVEDHHDWSKITDLLRSIYQDLL